MPAIYHEGSWLGNATDPEVLVKDTVGWTGKNLLKNTATSQTINGVTFTVNADKSVTVNGTATANTVFPLNLAIKSKLEENGKYILSGCPSGGATNKYKLDFRTVTASSSTDAIYNDIGEGATFTLTNAQYSSYELGVTIRIENGATVNNLIFYPMLRKADITDPTYEPYHESVEEEIEQIYADNGVLGAKNLLRLNAGQGIGTYNGFTVTYNYNSDGTIKNVVFNGTSTQSAGGFFYQFAQRANNNPIKLTPNTTYIFSIDNQNENVSLQVGYTKNNSYFVVKESPFGADSLIFVAPADCEGAGWTIQLIKKSGSLVLNNWTVYPMLRLASDPDDTYQPYAMTNRELTPQIVYNQNNICVCKQGKIVITQFNGAKPSDIAALNFANMGAKPAFYVNTFQCRCDAEPTTIEINANGTVVNVGYYASYGATYTDLKSDSSKSVNGSICFIAE